MMWYWILSALVAHLKAWPDLTGTDIIAGTRNPLPESTPAIQIRRGATDELEPYDADHGTETLWIECWEQSKDADLGIGYGLLADLEARAIAAIDAWLPGTETVGGAQVHTKVVTVEPDGDLFRPHVGCRIVVSAEWRKVN